MKKPKNNHNFDGKQMYEFTKKYRPNDLGSAIISYVEQLKSELNTLKGITKSEY
tara:strand:+ start:84 stop:245 length:162 start_codon:yes stop_codon:yes gene_type:complete